MKQAKAKSKKTATSKSATKKFPTKAATIKRMPTQGGMPMGRPDMPLAETPNPQMMM